MPAITRIGDMDMPHCGPMTRAQGSPDTFLNGRPISRQGDMNTPHLKPGGTGCIIHLAPITKGSSTNFVNGKGMGRVGDQITECTAVAQGSEDAFSG